MIFKYQAKYNKRVEAMQLWTHHNHAIELNTNEKMNSRIKYIHENPLRAGWVEEEGAYLYSSACKYSQLLSLSMLDI